VRRKGRSIARVGPYIIARRYSYRNGLDSRIQPLRRATEADGTMTVGELAQNDQ
jgi:hypothetical protein